MRLLEWPLTILVIHVGEVGLRLDGIEFAAFDQRCDDGPMLGSAIGPREERIFPVQCNRPDAAFDDIGMCALPRCTALPGNPGRQTLAPAGSTRGGPGGDEWPEALREKSPLGGQRTVRAATRVNIEQASKKSMWEPTRHSNGEGRRRR
jgi:hypothetical protein